MEAEREQEEEAAQALVSMDLRVSEWLSVVQESPMILRPKEEVQEPPMKLRPKEEVLHGRRLSSHSCPLANSSDHDEAWGLAAVLTSDPSPGRSSRSAWKGLPSSLRRSSCFHGGC